MIEGSYLYFFNNYSTKVLTLYTEIFDLAKIRQGEIYMAAILSYITATITVCLTLGLFNAWRLHLLVRYYRVLAHKTFASSNLL